MQASESQGLGSWTVTTGAGSVGANLDVDGIISLGGLWPTMPPPEQCKGELDFFAAVGGVNSASTEDGVYQAHSFAPPGPDGGKDPEELSLTPRQSLGSRHSTLMGESHEVFNDSRFSPAAEDTKKFESPQVMLPRRKTGRPLAYTGDPDSPSLTAEQRRRIRRRTSNRESARRIRDKQHAELDGLTREVARLRSVQEQSRCKAVEAERQASGLREELSISLNATAQAKKETGELRNELHYLRQVHEVDLEALEAALGRAEDAQELGTDQTSSSQATAAEALARPRLPSAREDSMMGDAFFDDLLRSSDEVHQQLLP